MSTLPNPFLNSTALAPAAVGSAVASSDLQPRATAELISVSPGEACSSLPSGESDPSVTLDFAPGENLPSMTNGGGQETPASAPSKNPDVGVLADRIDWHAFFDAVIDERIVLFELYDEVPLFIRAGDHLRRWEA